jgi:hypothetical protein
MANLAPIGVQVGADTTVSELLAHWIAEQQQRNDLCQRERPPARWRVALLRWGCTHRTGHPGGRRLSLPHSNTSLDRGL